MQLIEKFTVLEDGDPIGTFDTYEQAADDIRVRSVIGSRYQIMKEFIVDEEPRQTVADTGWRDEYRGMWAEEMDNEALCLVMARGGSSAVWIMGKNTHETGYVASSNLVLRYDLAPVNLTPHPAYLETLEDYQNAPVGTVVSYKAKAAEIYASYVKDGSGEWAGVGIDNYYYSTNLAGDRRRVLYWPEEEE